MTSCTVAVSVTSPWGPSSELRLQPQGAPPAHTRGPRRPSVGILDSAHESPTNTTATEGDRPSIRPLKNISDEVIRRKYCFLWRGEKSAFRCAPEPHRQASFFLPAADRSVFINTIKVMWEASSLITTQLPSTPHSHSTTSAAGNPGFYISKFN